MYLSLWDLSYNSFFVAHGRDVPAQFPANNGMMDALSDNHDFCSAIKKKAP
ncbi:MAG: hypothetical protein ABIN94_10425 [Ferruginibacter sp.]